MRRQTSDPFPTSGTCLLKLSSLARLYGKMGRYPCHCLMVRATALAGRGSGVLDRLEALSSRFSRQQPSKDEPLVPSEPDGRQAAAASRRLAGSQAGAGRVLRPPPIDTRPPDTSPCPSESSHLQRRSSSVLQTRGADAGVERPGLLQGIGELPSGWLLVGASACRAACLPRCLPAAL